MTIASQLKHLNTAVEITDRARQFSNLALAVAMGRGQHTRVQQIVHDNRVKMGPTIQKIVENRHHLYDIISLDLLEQQKAAVAAGTTSDAIYALPLSDYQQLANAFLESLRNYGAFDRMLPFMRRVPFRVRVGASTIGVTGTTVPQQQIKPISKLT